MKAESAHPGVLMLAAVATVFVDTVNEVDLGDLVWEALYASTVYTYEVEDTTFVSV